MQAAISFRRFAVVNFNFADFPTGVFTPVWILPFGAEVLSGELVITTASNAASTDTIEAGISSNSTRNLTAKDAKTVAKTAFDALTAVDGETFGITRRLGGAAGTAGKGYLRLEFLNPAAVDEVIGALPNPKEANEST